MSRRPKKTPLSPWKKYVVIGAGVLGMVVVTLVALTLAFTPREPAALTTTLDLEHKQILGEANGGDSSAVWGEIRDVLEDFSGFLADQALSLQALATPSTDYVRVRAGMRREEIADSLAGKLNWSEQDRLHFLAYAPSVKPGNPEGYYEPGTYLLSEYSTPGEIARQMTDRFADDVTNRYATSTRKIINLDTALKIASIIQREAGSKSEMKLISGVIWNRMFQGMPLQMDATLQYAKGNEDIGWWPQVKSEDKYIDSPYNTYQNNGLPPTPISNVDIAAVDAALNPKKTTCLFYLHDKYRRLHCSDTYQQHLRNINYYY